MNNLMIFENKPVEVFEFNGKSLFNPYHVGECLELGDSAVRMAISKMNEKQVIKLTNSNVKDIDFRKHQLKIKEPLEKRLSYITADMINQTLANTLSTGLLRITDEGSVVDKDVLFSEANKLRISKHDIKVKLKLLNKIIYKQVRINGQNMWCIVVKR